MPHLFRFALPFLALLVPLAPSAQQAPMVVGTASAAAGEKATVFIEVPAAADPGTRIPVIVARGAKPGPVLVLVGGAHGTEYASIIALEKLAVKLDPGSLSGTVIILPLGRRTAVKSQGQAGGALGAQ